MNPQTDSEMNKMKAAAFQSFTSLDIRVGTILHVSVFEEAIKPAYKLRIDFGEELGELQSSAQITELYTTEALAGKQVLAVVNFPPKQIANFMSECLVLGLYTGEGVVLLQPDRPCVNGSKMG